eukprot:COSAG01_NODE_799_length_13501_cov_15.980749_21_plen_84_part_00
MKLHLLPAHAARAAVAAASAGCQRPRIHYSWQPIVAEGTRCGRLPSSAHDVHWAAAAATAAPAAPVALLRLPTASTSTHYTTA